MANDWVYNDFTKGIVYLITSGMLGTPIYQNGVKELTNMVTMLQGGVTRRPGTVRVRDNVNYKRVISATFNLENSTFIFFSEKQILLLDNDVETIITTEYLEKDLDEIQYVQTSDSLYFVHRDYKPKKLLKVGTSYLFSDFTISSCDDETYRVAVGSGFDNYIIKFDELNYPGVIAFIGNRLWLASSYTNPYRLWISRPFEHNNFQGYDIVEYLDEVATAKDYAEAIKNDKEIPAPVKAYRMTVSADNALILDIGSSKNDRIEWITPGANVLVGTSSSEWAIPSSINAVNFSISNISSYGSIGLQAQVCNFDTIFIQRGGRIARGYVSNNGSYGCLNLNIFSDDILKSGVKSMAWQSVPEPRLYVVLKDGTVAVLSYDRQYEISAWSKWNLSNSKILDIEIVDTLEGQDIYALTDKAFVKFDDNLLSDEGETFVSSITTNALDYINTIGRFKKINKAFIRVINTGKFNYSYSGKSCTAVQKEFDMDVVEIANNMGYQKNLYLKFESYKDDPLCILAMRLQVEVN